MLRLVSRHGAISPKPGKDGGASMSGSGPSFNLSSDLASPSTLDAQLQREVDEALGDQSMEQIIAQADAQAAAASADAAAAAAADGGDGTGGEAQEVHVEMEMRRGRIVSIRQEDVFVELAGAMGKLQGVVPLKQFDRPPRPGSIMDFVVERIDEAEGLVLLSREGAVTTATWAQLTRGAVVEARVISTNKGGLDMEMVGGIRAFMPASQIDMHHVGELEPFTGEKLHGIVMEIDRKSRKVVISRRRWLEHERERQKKEVWKALEVGQVREGKITSLAEYGAFVDLGGCDGLVHVTDLSYSHVNKPSDVVQVGQVIRVKVLKLDAERGRISLGLKQVEPDPWENIAVRYQPGEQVSGRILRTASFGAFVELEKGVEGLLPISEMSWSRIGSAEEVVKANDVVRLSVLAVDAEKKRISLSLKQTSGDPWVGAEHKYARGQEVAGKIVRTTDFGAFVELEPGVEGLVHISELSDRRVNSVEDVVKAGESHSFRVLEADEENHKIRLSIKALKAPPPALDMAGPVAAESGKPAAHGKPAVASKPTRKQKRGDLKSGLGQNAALGMGLGDLKL
jgi:small subunit ribosomal protein S1